MPGCRGRKVCGPSLLLGVVLLSLWSCTVTSQYIKCGMSSTCTLSQGKAWCWGLNEEGLLATGNYLQLGVNPGDMAGLKAIPFSSSHAVVQLSVQEQQACAVFKTRQVMCWGLNDASQLGYGHTTSIGLVNNEIETLKFLNFNDLVTARPMAVSLGQSHTCSVTYSGQIRCWGSGADGRLGHDAVTDIPDSSSAIPLVFGTADAALQVVAGAQHTCALFVTNFVRCWGLGGRLGDGSNTNAGDGVGTALNAVGAITWASGSPVHIDTWLHTCVLFDTKTVRCFGINNGQGNLGYNNAAHIGNLAGTAVNTLGTLAFAPVVNVATVAVGEDHSCVVFENGQVKCWGSNSDGQLGITSTNDVGTAGSPLNAAAAYVAFPGGAADHDVVAISLGSRHSCSLHKKATLTIRCWGSGFHGQLGLDSPLNVGDHFSRPTSGAASIAFPTALPPPAYFNIWPGTSVSTGGDQFKITGLFSTHVTWFSLALNPVYVKFDDGAGSTATASGQYFKSTDVLQGVFPAFPMGGNPTKTVSVHISNNNVVFYDIGVQATFQVTPVIASISPLGGNVAGGTKVTVVFTNPLDYRDIHTCAFGGTTVKAEFDGDKTLVCDPAPANGVGPVALTIDPGLALPVPIASTFTYSDMVVSGMTPRRGRIGGGTATRLTATGVVDVGVGVQCVFTTANITVPATAAVDAFGVNCTTPDMKVFDTKVALPVDVQVHLSNDLGQSLSSTSAPFGLHADISLESIDPDGVPLNSVTDLTLKGRGFFDTDEIRVRFIIGSQVSILNGTYNNVTGDIQTVAAVASLSGIGKVDVTFNLQDYTRDAVPFSYYEVYNSWPVGGDTNGGTIVTVIGAGFRPSGPDLKCRFNNTDVQGTFLSSSKMLCTSPESNHTGTFHLNATVNGYQYTTANETLWTYFSPPAFHSMSPQQAASVSNTSALLTVSMTTSNVYDLGPAVSGRPGASCKLGDIVGTPVIDANPSTFSCVLPRTVGTHKMTLSLNGQETYDTGMTVSFFDLFKLETTLGPASGGTEVLMYGSGFSMTGTPKCMFGGIVVPATPLSVVEVKCITPAASEGKVYVEYSPDGVLWTHNKLLFEYYKTPHVQSVSPQSSPGTGGTKVTVSGTDFRSTGSMLCRFGLATSPAVLVGSHLECVTPDGYGEVTIEVSFNAGLSWSSDGVKFYFTVIGSINPPIGPLSGSTLVRVVGVGFSKTLDSTTYCQFGPTKKIKSTYIDDLTVQCMSPPRDSKTFDEVLVTSNGEDYGKNGPIFDYYDNPGAIDLLPKHGSKDGGTVVTVIGFNFFNSRRVTAKFRGALAPEAFYVTPSLIFVTTPPGEGAKQLEVSLNGVDYFHVGIFNFFSLLDISPRSGPVPGGTVVQVSGTGFLGARDVQCKLGDSIIRGTVIHAGLVECTVPAAKSLDGSAQQLKISANGGQEFVTSGGSEADYTYYTPVSVTAVSPITGSSAGGYPVTLYGSSIVNSASLSCKFGDEFDSPMIRAEFVSSSQIICEAKPHLPGLVRPAISINGQQVHESIDYLFEFKDCPAGTFAAVHSDPCTPCPPGTFTNIVGAKECLSCNQESYAPKNGTVRCEFCPDNTLIEDLERLSESQCTCAPGFWTPLLRGGVPCEPCPEGATCPGGTNAPLPQPNWWNAKGDPFAFLPCENTEQCPGGEQSACAPGYKGRLCALCEADYFARGSYCARCPQQSYWLLVAFVIFLLAAMGILVKLVGKSASAFGGTINIAFYFFQVLGILKNLDLKWPRSIDSTLDFVTAPFTLNLDILASECSIPLINYHVKWVGMLSLPVLFGVCFYGMYVLAKFKMLSSKDEDAEKAFISAKHVLGDGYLLFMALMYLVLVSTALEHFDCTKLADGRFTLDAQPDLICYDKLWWTMTPIALTATVMYGIVTPVFFLVLINRHKHDLARAETVEMMGSIYIEYKPTRPYWEVVVMFEKAAISICLTYFTVHPDMQILAFLLILMAGLAANMLMEPFFVHRYNRLQNALRWCSCVMLLAGMLFRASKFPNPGAELFVVALVFMTIGAGIALVTAIVIYDIIVIRKGLKRNMEDNTFDYLAELAHPQGKTAVLEWLSARPKDSPDNIRYMVETLYKMHKYLQDVDDSEMLRYTREVSVTDTVLTEYCSSVFYEESIHSIRHWVYVNIELAKVGDDRAMADIRRFHGIFADLGNYVRYRDATDRYDGVDSPFPRVVNLAGQEVHVPGFDKEENQMILEMQELERSVEGTDDGATNESEEEAMPALNRYRKPPRGVLAIEPEVSLDGSEESLE